MIIKLLWREDLSPLTVTHYILSRRRSCINAFVSVCVTVRGQVWGRWKCFTYCNVAETEKRNVLPYHVSPEDGGGGGRGGDTTVWVPVCASAPLWLHFSHEAFRQKTSHCPIQTVAETLGPTERSVAPGATMVTLFGLSTTTATHCKGEMTAGSSTHTHSDFVVCVFTPACSCNDMAKNIWNKGSHQINNVHQSNYNNNNLNVIIQVGFFRK